MAIPNKHMKSIINPSPVPPTRKRPNQPTNNVPDPLTPTDLRNALGHIDYLFNDLRRKQRLWARQGTSPISIAKYLQGVNVRPLQRLYKKITRG